MLQTHADPNTLPGVLKIMNIDVGIFAHNEENNLSAMLESLSKQSALLCAAISVKIFVLANGCTDDTVRVADSSIKYFDNTTQVAILELEHGGKSRTWNAFVHQISRPEADLLIFLDADILLPEKSSLLNMICFVAKKVSIQAASSLPVKDIDYYPRNLHFVEKIISAGGGTSGQNIKTAVCGQFYALRSQAARKIKLPIGLPVEDGYIRQAIITDVFKNQENQYIIDQPPNVMHVYPSERTIVSLLNHQTRIVIGSAINAALFSHFQDLLRKGQYSKILSELEVSASSPLWLKAKLKELLPRFSHGWVPWAWLFSRTKFFIKFGPFTLRRCLVALLGACMDLTVFLYAQIRMALGTGAGHW